MNYPRPGYFYDCNSQSLTALQCLNATLQNPAGSGKNIIVEAYAIPNLASTGTMGTLIHMPTGNLPTTVYKPLPYIVGTDISSPNNIGIFKANLALLAAPLNGGTPIISVPVKPSDRNYVEAAPLTIPPGVTLGWTFSPGIIISNITFAIYTREENI